uniref:H15 domain-containing protein n=1 Tax=Oncorhynchus mykiss TaxID=8022 RepID=A0A8K9UFJ1_ONCMY
GGVAPFPGSTNPHSIVFKQTSGRCGLELILRVVSQCKHRGGISMVDLKHALAAGGYDVTKNNTRVNLAVKGLVRKETLVQTTGVGASGSFKLNKVTNKTVVGKGQREIGDRPKQVGKSHKPAGQASKSPAKVQKTGYKAPKSAGKSLKAANQKTRKMVVSRNTKRASLWKWTEYGLEE